MNKTNVLHFITGLYPGGAERMMQKTVAHLSKRYAIHIGSLIAGTLKNDLAKNYPVHVLNTSNPLLFPVAILELRRLIKRHNIRIVHSYLFHANIVARFAAIGTKAKVISSIRIREKGKKSHLVVDKITSFLVDKYTAVSHTVRDFVIAKEGIPPEKIIAIPNGIDVAQFTLRVNKNKKLKELGLSGQRPILASIANLRWSKDYPTLFSALKSVLKKKPVDLLVVGNGEAELELKKKATQLGLNGNVHFLGYRDDVPELLAISDLCILATLYEGQSNALLEYMATKKPIIATNIPENREVLTHTKEGLLVPPKQPQQLAGAILTLLRDNKLRATLASNAYARVKKYHDIKRVAKQTEQLYEELLQ